jgi:hypothetical protein
MYKTLITILVLGIIAISGALFLEINPDKSVEDGSIVESGNESRAKTEDNTYGFEFESRTNPLGYVVQKREGNSENPELVSYTLMLKTDYEELMNSSEGREGPPSMSISVYKNTKKQFVRNWAEENSAFSNINLKRTEIGEVTLSGANAIRYGADGLYVSDNVIAASGDFIYHLSVNYLDENSQIKKDFDSLLSSFKFIPYNDSSN